MKTHRRRLFSHLDFTRLILAGWLCLSLGACQAQAVTRPEPTLHLIHVQYTPVLALRMAAVHTCADELPSVGIVVSERPAYALDVSAADISLRIGMPDPFDGKAYPIGDEELAALVSPDSPMAGDTSAQIVAAYAGQLPDSQNPISIWSLPAGDDLRLALEQQGIQGTSASVAPGPVELRASVAANVHALGVLTQAWSDASVHSIPLGVSVPALALTPAEPAGPVRQIIACLQK
jgi:hypothetical protein